MSTILYIIYENNETTPTTYYPEVYSRTDIDIDQIASLINEAHQTIDVALVKVTLLEMAEVIKRELADGYWVSFDDFMTFQTGINAESTDTEIYLDEDDLQVIGYVYNAFTDAIEDAATFELLKYGFPRAPWILSAVDSKYGLVGHVVDNHGLTITGEDFVIDKSDTDQGVWIKSPAGNDYRQNKYTYVSSTMIIITAELSGEDGPAGKNSVEVELSIRASYDGGETISTGTYEKKLRRINQISNTENKAFLKDTQTTCGVTVKNLGYQQYEEIIIYASVSGTGIEISLYEGKELKDTANITGNEVVYLYGTGHVKINISDYSSFLSNLSAGLIETIKLMDVPGEWSPADITTTLWLDAEDSETIIESGGFVSQWNDKSGNENHATQIDTNKQPVYTQSDSMLSNMGSVGSSTHAGQIGLDIPSLNAQEIYVVMYYDDGVNSTFDDNAMAFGGAIGTGTPRIMGTDATSTWNQSASFADAGAYKNGSESSTINAIPMPATIWRFESLSQLTSLTTIMYSETTADRNWKGAFGEIIIVPEPLSSEERINMYTYLSEKWNITI